jgi:diguanylate cyclase (GGDEF)-like protein
LDLGEDTLQVTVSIGVCSHIGKSVEEMITRADQLLYEAKQTGKNRVVTDR